VLSTEAADGVVVVLVEVGLAIMIVVKYCPLFVCVLLQQEAARQKMQFSCMVFFSSRNFPGRRKKRSCSLGSPLNLILDVAGGLNPGLPEPGN
jgi:hypothetical protein